MSSPIFSLLKTSTCYRYAEDVLSGKELTGVKVKQACQRFINEIEFSKKEDYPWTFDVEKAYKPIEFMERFCKPTKSNYTKMELLPWQHFVEGNIYGWVDKKTGLRRFREALILVGAGNGKSTLISGNAIYGSSKDGERGAEVYCLANSKDQAKIIFDEVRAEINCSPLLKKHFRATRDGVFFDATNSKIQALATDSTNLDGRNVHMAVFDEIQEYRDYKLINIIKGKMKKRRQPLVIYISTLGTVIDGVLMDYYILGSNILSNEESISKIAADRTFVYIAEIDENDDVNDSSIWKKANPSLDKLLKLEDLEYEWERCKLVPAERSNFINKQLNVFTAVDELSFLDTDTIRKNNKEIDIETLKGRRCYGGFDLSETEDFTSACLEFPLENGDLFILSHSWVPQKKVEIDREKLDWKTLVDKGHLTIVDGAYVDYNLVFNWFVEMQQKYRIDTIGYDPAKAYLLVQELKNKGLVLNEVRQGELTLTAPLDDLKEKYLDAKIIHNNNPLFRWYLGNVKLKKRSVNSTYLPTKQNAYRKIDGFAASLNAHTEYLRRNPVYIPPEKELATIINLGGLKK